MRAQNIAQLEARLEGLVEGAFARLFGPQVRPQDLALALMRAMEGQLYPGTSTDARAVAPNLYRIYLHQNTAQRLLQHHPLLPVTLSRHLTELAQLSGYRLQNAVRVELLPTPQFDANTLHVEAAHHGTLPEATGVLTQPVTTPANGPTPPAGAQLVIGSRTISLSDDLISIGRSLDNDIVLDDLHTSRLHAQLRLRDGQYWLFDAQSSAGTFVNDVRVREHLLQAGDVLRLGGTRMVYFQDEAFSDVTDVLVPTHDDPAP